MRVCVIAFVLVLGLGTGACSFRAPGAPDAEPMLHGDGAAGASDVPGGGTPRSCAAALAENPAATDGVYTIDVDGNGAQAPFEVACDMTNGGWTLVARELAGIAGTQAGALRFLGVDSMNASAIAAGSQSGVIGVRFAGAYTAVRIAWAQSQIVFAKPAGFDLFGNVANASVNVDGFSTTDANLASWVANAGGAKLCVAARTPNARPGDTSWAVKARDDGHASCGCNDGGWAGRGAYYAGTPNGQTSCNGHGGGWAGVKDDGVPKSGFATTAETRIWIE